MISIPKLLEELEILPDQIRQAELDYVKAESDKENAKLKYDVTLGMALVASKRGNATEKKSDAIIISEKTATELIGTEYKLAKKKAEFNYLTNKFIAYRKISSIKEKTMQADGSGF